MDLALCSAGRTGISTIYIKIFFPNYQFVKPSASVRSKAIFDLLILITVYKFDTASWTPSTLDFCEPGGGEFGADKIKIPDQTQPF